MVAAQPVTTPAQLQDAVRAYDRVTVRGGGSKPALSAARADATQLDLRRLRGILEYEPAEYTFTAYAATPVAEVAAELQTHGQYLPFDPLLAAAGATLGGTVAANLSGSGRYRFGGVRDFILGVRFVDGRGELVRGGGKVVKNAAGFDLPKLLVGSLGRYGVLVELTFKVFPQPPAYTTLLAAYPTLADCLAALFALNTAPLELDALDMQSAEDGWQLVLRLGGLPEALPGRVERLSAFLRRQSACRSVHPLAADPAAEAAYWWNVNGCAWRQPGQTLVKIPLAPRQIAALDARIGSTAGRRYSAGGNVAWIGTPDSAQLSATLAALDLVGLQLTGTTDEPILGTRKGLALAQRIKQALDPTQRFPGY